MCALVKPTLTESLFTSAENYALVTLRHARRRHDTPEAPRPVAEAIPGASRLGTTGRL